MSYYGIGEILKNGIALLYTKIRIKNARLIRLPIYIRGERYIKFGDGVTTGYRCRLEVDGNHGNKKCMVFGNNVNIGDDVRISCANQVFIGDNTLLAGKILIVDNSHGNYKGENQSDPSVPPNMREIISSPIVIKENVWIGEGTVVQQGVTIGRGSIIAANSVVTSSVPECCIAGGVPAKILKVYNQKKSEWERYE